MLHNPNDATKHARKLWDELGQVAKVEAAIDAWHAINTKDMTQCQFWKDVFAELDRLEAENAIKH